MEKMWQHSCGTVLPANHVQYWPGALGGSQLTLGGSQLQLQSNLRWAQPEEVLGYSIEVIAVEVETRLQIATHSCW